MTIALGAILACCSRQADDFTGVIYTSDHLTVYTDSIVSGGQVAVPDSRPLKGADLSFTSGVPVVDGLYWQSLSRAQTVRPALLTAADVELAMAFVNPRVAKKAVSAMMADHQAAEVPQWAPAAWEIYKVTGDSVWLRQAYAALDTTLRQACHILRNPDYKLLADGVAALGDTMVAYPGWMRAVDRFEAMSLRGNIGYIEGCNVAARMAAILGANPAHWLDKASAAIDAVNEHLWMSAAGCYTAYLYGSLYFHQAPCTDNVAQARSILYGVSGHPRGHSLMYHTIGGAEERMPYAEAYWAMAAASLDDLPIATAAFAGVLGDAAFSRGSSAAASFSLLAAVYRVLLGISFEADGMTFSPAVPQTMPGTKHLEGLRYRDATLDITVTGCGSTVASFQLDGEELPSRCIDASISGSHRVEIVLANNRPLLDAETVATADTLSPTPRVVWTTGRNAVIEGFKDGDKYKVYLNDAFREEIDKGTYQLYDSRRPVQVTIASASKGGSFMSRPHLYIPSDLLTVIPADSMRLACAPEENPDSVLRLPCDSVAPGRYVVDATYGWDGRQDRNAVDLFEVLVDDSYAGMLAMPAPSDDSPAEQASSSMVRVTISSPSNILRIERVDNGKLGHGERACLNYIRLIREE